jgi:hypothetical protein
MAFQEAGQLGWYATSVFFDPSRWPYKLERYVPRGLSNRLNREFRRRYYAPLNPNAVRQFGWWEWSEVLLRRLGRNRLADRCNARGNRAFCKQVISLFEREPVDVLWGFNSSTLEVFQWARKRGICCILDQTIGHPAAQNQVMCQEQERHPQFFIDCYRPLDQAWIDRQNAEVAEADLVVVGSDFCARTMVETAVPVKKFALSIMATTSRFSRPDSRNGPDMRTGRSSVSSPGRLGRAKAQLTCCKPSRIYLPIGCN